MDAVILNIGYAHGAVHLLKQLYNLNVKGWDILLPIFHARVCFHNVAKKRAHVCLPDVRDSLQHGTVH